MDPNVLRTLVEDAVQAKLSAGVAFTSACISHPIIKNNPTVRHSQVSGIVRDMWAAGQIVGDDDGMQTDYNRTFIDVYPNGPGSAPEKAFCYHPDSVDPYAFKATTRVLIRNAASVKPVSTGSVTVPDMTGQLDDDDDNDNTPGLVMTTTNLASGDAVTKQCDIQSKNSDTLNVPRYIIKAAGWSAGDAVFIDVDAATRTATIHRTTMTVVGEQVQKVDKEGRVRLHGQRLTNLSGDIGDSNYRTTFTAKLCEPIGGGDKYIQVS